MFKHTISFLVLMCVGLCALRAQSESTYAGVKCEGLFPKEIAQMLKERPSDANYTVRREVMQGNLIFGTKMNAYLDKIVENLLKDETQLRSQIHVYILRSAEVNAYATESGVLFVNLGMLAQVSNESELAFVLAHEISHFALGHKVYAESYYKRFDKNDGLERWLEFQNELRQNETAADKTAAERFFKNSNYSYVDMMGIFDVLQYSDLPFSEVAFDRSYTESSCYQFPDKYFLTTVQPITNRDDRVDTLSTHPNIAKRRSAMNLQLARVSNDGRSAFVQSKELFEQVRKMARYACVELYLTEHEYDRAIYNINVLSKLYPNDPFLEEAKAVAWYGFSLHKNGSSSMEGVVTPYKQVEGEMQQVCHFMSKLSRTESSALALRFLWDCAQKYPENSMIQNMLESEMEILFVKNKKKHADFCDYPMGTDPATIPDEVDTTTNISNKYDRIRNQNVKVKPDPKFKTVNYMLCDLHGDSAFVALANRIIAAKEDEHVLNLVGKRKPSDEEKVYMDDFVVKVYDGKKTVKSDIHNRQKSEAMAKDVTQTLQKSVKHLKLESVSENAAQVANYNATEYNRFCKMQQWQHDVFSSKLGDDYSIFYQSRGMDEVTESLGVSKYVYAYATQEPASRVSGVGYLTIATTLLCPASFPVLVVNAALPRYQTEVQCGVLDINTGKVEAYETWTAKSKMSRTYIKSIIYNMLYDFKKGGKQ